MPRQQTPLYTGCWTPPFMQVRHLTRMNDLQQVCPDNTTLNSDRHQGPHWMVRNLTILVILELIIPKIVGICKCTLVSTFLVNGLWSIVTGRLQTQAPSQSQCSPAKMAIILVLACQQCASSMGMTTTPNVPTEARSMSMPHLCAGTSKYVKFLCSTPALPDDTEACFTQWHWHWQWCLSRHQGQCHDRWVLALQPPALTLIVSPTFMTSNSHAYIDHHNIQPHRVNACMWALAYASFFASTPALPDVSQSSLAWWS